MFATWRVAVWSMAVGMLGAILAWGVLLLLTHIGQQNDRVNQLWDLEVRRAQAVAQTPAAPAPPTVP